MSELRNRFRDFRPPCVSAQPSDESGSKQSATCASKSSDCMDLVLEIVKYCLFAFVTILVLLVSGPRIMVPVTVALYVIAYRFGPLLVTRGYVPMNRCSSSDGKTDAECNSVPTQKEHSNKLNQLDWYIISKIPGVDAERLKDTFESLYRRLDEGTLTVKDNGEWEPIQPEAGNHSDGLPGKLKTA